MATQPTNLPVPSESPRDLKFNAGKIDEFVTSLVNTYVDRFGNEHYTIEGLRWLAQQAIAQYGWILIDSFQDGADITLPNQALRDEDTGEYYRWDGALPKHVDAGSTPETSGGVGVGAWVGIGDASLRAMLATSAGAGMIGALDSDGNTTTVQQAMNHYRVMTIKGRLDEELSVKAFGAVGDGVADDTSAIQEAIDYSILHKKSIYIPRGDYLITSTIECTSSVMIEGDGTAFYGGGSRIICGTEAMVAFNFQWSENRVSKLIVVGFEKDIGTDSVNGYGQLTTCTGFKFVRPTGVKDIDSEVRDCVFVAFNTAIYATGANLKMKAIGITACTYGIDLYPAEASTGDFRGFIIDDIRFHKCGSLYNTASICIRTNGIFKNSCISNIFADAGNNRLYSGSLAEGAVIHDVTIRYMSGIAIQVDNTGITPSETYQTYRISDVSYQTPSTNLAQTGDWCISLINAPGGTISGINTAFTRKGAVVATGCTALIISNINVRSMGVNYLEDGSIYDAINLNTGSANCQIANVLVRNLGSALQTRYVVCLDSSSGASLKQISGVNVGAITGGAGGFHGELFNAANAPGTTYGNSIPTSGQYITGHIHWNTAPTSGGVAGWYCITGGAPGAWRAITLSNS